MRVKFPKYYSRFCCIKGECTDSCCIGWDIEIDSATGEKYDSLGEKADKMIKGNIYRSDKDGCSYIRVDDSGRCPFLNSEGLCDIITEYGEEFISDICIRHPRYLTRVDGIAEGGIGLCCLTAAEIILGAKADEFKEYYVELPYEVEESIGMLPYKLEKELVKYRKEILKTVIKRDTGAAQALFSVLEEGDLLERYIDYDADPDMPCESIPDFCGSFDGGIGEVASDILERLSQRELLTEEYKTGLEEAAKKVRENGVKLGKYLEKTFKPYLKRLLYYFLHRYFLEGLCDCSVGVRTKLAGIYALSVGALCFCRGNSKLAEIAITAKDFSKNIEYSEDNTEKNISDTYSYYLYTRENLRKIFK